MTAPLLADALGPRARRVVLMASIVTGLVIAGLVAVAVLRLLDKGQLASSGWEPLTRWSVLRFLLGGMVQTLKVAGVAMGLAMAVGALMALGRLGRRRLVRWPAVAYIEFFRAVPLLLLILFTAFALPRYGVHLALFWYLVIALLAYNSAVLAEIFCFGIPSLDRGRS